MCRVSFRNRERCSWLCRTDPHPIPNMHDIARLSTLEHKILLAHAHHLRHIGGRLEAWQFAFRSLAAILIVRIDDQSLQFRGHRHHFRMTVFRTSRSKFRRSASNVRGACLTQARITIIFSSRGEQNTLRDRNDCLKS